jgi:outer membrane protein TolC
LVLTATLTLLLLAPPTEGPPTEGPRAARDHHDDAQQQGPALSFDEAVGASEEAPRVRGFGEAATRKRDLDDDISMVPIGPELQVLAGGRVRPRENTGFEIQITATQSWSLDAYARKRKEAAKAETAVLEVEVRAKALEQQLAAAHAWVLLHAAERELELALAELAELHALGETLEQARAAGVGTRADVADARARAAAVEQRVGELRSDVHDLGLVLARETSGDTSQPARTSGEYPNPHLASEAHLRQVFAQVESLPQVARQRLRARAERARSLEVEAEKSTQLNAGGSFQRESGSDVVLFAVLGGRISTSHGERERGSAAAAARMAEAEAEAEALALEAALTIALHDLHHTKEQVDILREHTLPAHVELVESRQQALRLGEGTRALVLEAQARRHAVERELAAAEARWVWARVEVWLYHQAFLAEGTGE